MISVIVPVYNAEKTLSRCIESVLQQSFSDFELLLINDGSVDSSEGICRFYQQKDMRIQLISQHNMGVSAARNTGLDHSSGEYILFLDSDDELLPDAMHSLYQKAVENDADIVLSGIQKIYPDRGPEALYPLGGSDFEFWNHICFNSEAYGYCFAKLFRSKTVGSIRFNQSMTSQEDLNFCIRVYAQAKKITDLSVLIQKYYYVKSTRTPKPFDYLNNQIMIYQFALNKTEVSDGSKDKINGRIDSLIYGILYNADTKKNIKSAVRKINILLLESRIDTLFSHSKITRWCIDESFGKLWLYFKFRKTAGCCRKLLRG